MAAIGAALIYFVMPFDFVPDILAGFGLVDDLALVAFVMQKVTGDLQAFSQWDIAQRGGGDVVDSVASTIVPGPETAASEPGDEPNPAESDEAIQAVLAAVVGEKKDRKA